MSVPLTASDDETATLPASAARSANESFLAAELAHSKILQAISAELSCEDDPQALYEKLVDAAAALMHSDFASMQMLDPERGELRLLAFRGFSPQSARFWTWVRIDSASTCGEALRTKRRALVADVEDCPYMADTEDLATYRATGIRAVQTTPLLARSGKLVGMLSTHWPAPHQPRDRELRLLDILARQAADLIEKQQADAALRRSERKYRELIDALPAAVYTTDAEGRVTHFNPAAVELSGRTPDVGSDRWCVTWKLYRPDGTPLPHEQSPMAVALGTGKAVGRSEIIAERPDGSRVWVAAYPTPLVTDGRVTGGINMLLDITAQKRAEQANAQLAAIVESSDDAIISKDLAGTITSWNQAAERIYGYTAAEAIGRPVTMLMPSDRTDEEAGILERIRRGERVDHYETIRRRKDGSLLDISLTVSPITDARGQIIGASKIARDVTERKRAEEALKEADRRKDVFLAMLGHELRNPLSAITSAIQLSEMPNLSESDRLWVRMTLARQTDQLGRLVDDLLDVARITRDRIQLKQEPLLVADVVSRTIEATRPLIERARHKLEVTLPPEPLWVLADPARLQQIVSNLLVNAVKYTPEGGRISIRVAREGSQVAMAVQDNGIGLSPQMQTQVFDLFTQAEQGIDRAQGGLGIGLTLVRRLVERHGGSVSVASEGRGRGSEFTVRLPIIEPPSAAADESFADLPTARSLRILIVDDNRDAARTLGLLLKALGHETALAFDGRQALEVAGQFRPTVALLDLGLPEINGFDLAGQLKRSDPQIHLIAISGYGQAADRRRAQAAGFDRHFVKPVNIDELTSALNAVESLGATGVSPVPGQSSR